MNIRYNDFIGMYDGVFSDGYCSHMISEFERIRERGHCGNRQSTEGARKLQKEDEFYFLNLRNHLLSDFNNQNVMSIFWDGLQNCFNDYTDEFDSLKDCDLKCTSVKMQKTSPGGGYHV